MPTFRAPTTRGLTRCLAGPLKRPPAHRVPSDRVPSDRVPSEAPSEGRRRTRALAAPLTALCALALTLAACGDGRRYEGDILTRNDSDLTSPESMMTFAVARFGDPFTGDLLGSPLPPGSSDFLGSFREDFYDATAELELGDIYDWPDAYVGYERTTTFAFD